MLSYGPSPGSGSRSRICHKFGNVRSSVRRRAIHASRSIESTSLHRQALASPSGFKQPSMIDTETSDDKRNPSRTTAEARSTDELVARVWIAQVLRGTIKLPRCSRHDTDIGASSARTSSKISSTNNETLVLHMKPLLGQSRVANRACAPSVVVDRM